MINNRNSTNVLSSKYFEVEHSQTYGKENPPNFPKEMIQRIPTLLMLSMGMIAAA
jgi:hypothetical protein